MAPLKPTERFGGHLDMQGNRIVNQGTLIPSTTTNVLDFDPFADNVQLIKVGAATTFTTTNLAPGQRKQVYITCSVISTLTFPAGWTWYPSKLTATLLAKEIRLRLECWGTSDTDVRAEWVASA